MSVAVSGDYGLVGQSPQIASVRRLIEKAAANRLPVLLLGETGTGKEVVARALHAANPRGSFVPIDCGSLVGTLMESELYGHTKGSFSGAVENKKGLIELADGGTAFFDEIGDLPLEMQVKLLRLIQEREFRPVGALKWRAVDLRIIAATHRDLPAEIHAGRFRQDLYYRLRVFTIHLPPLREHKEDIRDLVKSLLAEMSQKHDRKVADVSEAVLNLFQSHSWPGNVRELRNTLERAVIVCEGGLVETKHLPPGFGQVIRPVVHDPDAVHLGVGTTVEEAERQLILKTLQTTNNNKTRAAEILGISLKTLHNKLKEYGRAADPVLTSEE